MKIGDWVYCCTIPGTARIIDFCYPWYVPGKRIFLVEFKNRLYTLFEWEVEHFPAIIGANNAN
jgi:hypothetical protein